MFTKSTFLVGFLSSVCVSTALAGSPLSLPTERDDLSDQDRERVDAITKATTSFDKAEQFEASQGGATTSRKKVNRNAFSNSSANLTFEDELNFKLGNALFRKFWVSSPSSNHASDGLGPLFNARSCQSCHLKDGRGHPPNAGEKDFTSMLFRLARPAETDGERDALETYAKLTLNDPVYGGQIQDIAVANLKPEARPKITYEEMPVELHGGEVVSLRKPTYSMENLAYGPLHPRTTLSPRIAQPMIGLGLIEAIHPADIQGNADAEDENKDGISGRLAVALNTDGKPVLGRFGWKAEQRSLESQNAGAFNGDIGISSDLNPSAHGDCTEAQTACLSLPNGIQKRLGETEAPDPVLELVTFYTANLAVPTRRDVSDSQVLHGKKTFYDIGCIACHTPKYVTSRKAERPEHRFQLIWPYSDFLLHDMGEGLADNQPVGAASGREWRTPPLWGIGLTETVNGHTFFLHDGRARNLTEAILWHGGEAQETRDRFASLPKPNRDAIIRFLESL